MATKAKFILSIDQGTSSSRAIVFDKKGKIRGTAQREVKQFYPNPGWVEQDADEIWNTTLSVIGRAIKTARITAESIEAIGITNQRETTVLWDRKSGKPVCKAIVWQSRQSEDICRALKRLGHEKEIRNRTGLVIDPYFSASKLTWIFKKYPRLLKRARKGELLFGTVDCWLIWKLSGGRSHCTDLSNASRTMLFNIHSCSWDDHLLKIFKVPAAILPKAVQSSGIVAHTDAKLLGRRIPIAGVAGDQQAALFGQRCIKKGMAKNTYGTGCFLLMNTGEKPISSRSGLLTTIAWKMDGKVEYALEGGVFIGGAAVKWLRDQMQMISKSSEAETAASRTESSLGLHFVPAFVGLGAPYWNSTVRGAAFGLTLGAGKDHFIRAVVESLAYQSKDLLRAMEKDGRIRAKTLRVDGGACVNDLLMQFQADILGIKVERPKLLETTAVGAAYLAGLGSGFWSVADLARMGKVGEIFKPKMSKATRKSLYAGWKRAVNAAILYSKEN